jgi:hypothetical protein
VNPSIQATEYHKSGRTMISFIMQIDVAIREIGA